MILAVDTETTGTDFFHGCKPFMITACNGTVSYIFEGTVNPYTREVTWEEDELNEFRSLVGKATKIIFHNTNFDIRALESIGIDPEIFWPKIEDTLLASHCICSGDSHNLKDLAVKYFNYSDDDEVLLENIVKERVRNARASGYRVAKAGDPHFPGIRANGTQFWKMDYWLAPDACREYAVRDVERTLLLWDAFKPSLLADNLWDVYQLRKKLLPIAYRMQTTGKHFNKPEALKLIAQLRKEMEEHRWEIKRQANIPFKFDPNKRQHLIHLVHKCLSIPVKYYTDKTSTTPAMDKKAIDSYAKEFNAPTLGLLALYKRKQKQATDIEGLINWLDENNRTHSSLNITGTRETRQSSNSPNDQNTDKVLRFLFGPTPGNVWISHDLVNIELRIWAYTVGNKELIDAFEQGKSVHQMIMEIIFPDLIPAYLSAKKLPESQHTEGHKKALKKYVDVKSGNFARIYGATENKTNETYHGGKNPPNYCAKIDARFPGIKEFTQSRVRMAENNYLKYSVFSVHTLGGYRLDVPPNEPFKATNYYVQGTAGLIMTQAMIAWTNHPFYRKFNCQLISQVHDSLDTEVPICPALPLIIEAKSKAVSEAGKKYIPTCESDWKLIYHPSDETNTIIQEILHS